MARTLILLGVVLMLVGLAWPWLALLGLGRLPGDIVIERGSFRLYLPIATSVVVCLALSLAL